MGERNFVLTATVLFSVVSLLHLWRAVSSLPLIFGVWELPVWLSYLAFLFIGWMAIWGWKLFKS